MEPSREILDCLLPQTFTPGSPVFSPGFLLGRTPLLREIRQGCARPGGCVVVYGEPGVGKTSLARLASTPIRGRFYRALDPHDSFDSIAGAALAYFREPSGTDRQRTSSTCETITTDEFVSRLPHTARLILLDDVQALEETATRRSLVELAGRLSVAGHPAALVIIGVARAPSELLELGDPPSATTRPIRVGPLGNAEFRELIARGAAALGVGFDAQATEMILEFSTGVARCVHLLCEGAVRSLLDESRAQDPDCPLQVTAAHVRESVERAIHSGQLLGQAVARSAWTVPR